MIQYLRLLSNKMPIKIILSLFAFLSFFIIAISWQQCIPGDCGSDRNSCSNSGPCVNETIAQHLSERIKIFNSTISVKSVGVFVISLLFFALFKGALFLLRRIIDGQFLVVMKIRSYQSARLYNYFLHFFSKGILNPKAYSLVS